MSTNDVITMLVEKIGNHDFVSREEDVNKAVEIVHCGMDYAQKNPRKNDNWDIVWAIPVTDDTEIVIGDRHTDFQPYVAWHCFHGKNYSWGHYCQTFGGAFDCAMEKVRKELHID